jgi:hypothetical protein
MSTETPQFSRRESLRLLAGTGLGFLAFGCNKSIEPEKPNLTALRKENQKAFVTLKDKPLMTDSDFKRINTALVDSPSPIFQQIGKSLNEAWNADKKPSYMPSWMSGTISPLVITYDKDRTSLAAIEGEYGDDYQFILADLKAKTGIRYPFIPEIKMGIHIGSPDFTRLEGVKVESLYLAKEWLQVLTSIACVPATVNNFRRLGYEFLDANTRQTLTDPKALLLAGLTTFTVEMSKEDSTRWLLADGLPVLIIVSQFDFVFKKGESYRIDGGLKPFLTAKAILEEPAYQVARGKINSLVEKWKSLKTPTLPENYFEIMLDPDVSKLILAMQKRVSASSNAPLYGKTAVLLSRQNGSQVKPA